MEDRPKRKMPTSFHLTDEARRLLKVLSAHLGQSQAAILERLIRELARKERVE